MNDKTSQFEAEAYFDTFDHLFNFVQDFRNAGSRRPLRARVSSEYELASDEIAGLAELGIEFVRDQHDLRLTSNDDLAIVTGATKGHT